MHTRTIAAFLIAGSAATLISCNFASPTDTSASLMLSPETPAPLPPESTGHLADTSDRWTILRVGGDPPHEVERQWDNFYAGPCAITTPLPDGYPDPTPPGAIDIKRYASVRRAEVTGSLPSDFGMNMAFFPLFQHIKTRDIAMTSPVEMDYPPAPEHRAEDSFAQQDRWTMSFLYRTPDLGAPGRAERNVRVVDTQPLTVLSIGLRGPYSESRIREALEPLYDWLAANPEWKIAGPPRALYYNGPERRNPDKWSEAQIPIRRSTQ